MNGTLILMNYIYNPSGFDWMNFKLTEDNPYTFHHIVERRHGGDKVIENGAILTSDAHKLLNILDQFCPEAYNDLQNVFVKINESSAPPTYELMKEIDEILQKLFCKNEYEFVVDMKSSKYDKTRARLVDYRETYFESRKELKKCLK